MVEELVRDNALLRHEVMEKTQRMDAMEQKMGPAMAAIMSNQEVATILNEAMAKFGEKTAAMDTVGEAYFGK